MRQLPQGDIQKIAAGDAHPPAGRGQCLTCHDSHGSATAGMTRRVGAALCTSCHDPKKPAIQAKHTGVNMATVNCTSCHDPHVQAKGAKGFLLPAKHLPFSRGECTSSTSRRGMPSSRSRAPNCA